MQSSVGISREVLEFKPILPKNNITYVREEKYGWKSIAFNSHIHPTPIFFSKMDAEFMELCDGGHTVQEIIENISTQNKDVPWFINMVFSNKLILTLTELRVIHGDNLNLVLKYNTLKLGDDTEIAELSYMQYKDYSEFIKEAFLDTNKYYFYMNPITNGQVYTEKDFSRKLNLIDYRIFVVRRHTQIVMVFMLKKGSSKNEYILDNLISVNDEKQAIKLEKFNLLLSCNNIRIKINTIHRDDTLIGFFNTEYKDEFLLKNELDNHINIIESNLYYMETDIKKEKDVGQDEV